MPKLKQSFLIIVVGLALAAGLSYAEWIGPTANPPESNVPAPINVSSNPQDFADGKTLKVKGGSGVLNLLGGLKINGVFQLADGTQCKGCVLTSDENGIAHWETITITPPPPFISPEVSMLSKTYTSSGNFAVEAGVTTVWVSGTGGGGGGSLGWGGGGGGAGAAIRDKKVSIASGEHVAVTVGAGGSYSKTSGVSAGGTSKFGSYVVLPGGGPGTVSKGGSSGGPGGNPGEALGAGGAGLFGYGGNGGFSQEVYQHWQEGVYTMEGWVTVYTPSTPGGTGAGGGGGYSDLSGKIGSSAGGPGLIEVKWCPAGYAPLNDDISSGYCKLI